MRIGALWSTSLLLAVLCAPGVAQASSATPHPVSKDGSAKPAAAPAKPTGPTVDQPSTPSAPLSDGRFSAAGLPDTSAAPPAPATSAFSSSFDATHSVEPKPPELDSPKVADLSPVSARDGQADPLSTPSTDPASAAIPGWAWVAMIALGVIAATVVRTRVARSSREPGSGRLSTWLAPHCPYCQNPIARPSSRRSAFESWVLPLLLIAPVRCLDCRRRYYSLIFFARGSGLHSS
jgi:hypothetical protein